MTQSKRMKGRERTSAWRRLGALLGRTVVVLAVTIVLLEGVLWIHNPVLDSGRAVATSLNLPINQRYRIETNGALRDVSAVVHHTRNGLGFRGPEWDEAPEGCRRWIAIGGSTTEGFFLNTEETWPARLAELVAPLHDCFWLNNAGLDAHSSFGHLVLVNQAITALDLDLVLVMAGINDVGLGQPRLYDDRLTNGIDSLDDWLKRNTQLGRLTVVLDRARTAKSIGVSHSEVRLDPPNFGMAPVETAPRLEALAAAHEEAIKAFGARLDQLADRLLAHEIIPVFLTQPALFGGPKGGPLAESLHRDPFSQNFISGFARWRILEAYNDETRRLANRDGVFVIDLARALPKSIDLYYDWMHFNRTGATTTAREIYDDLTRQGLLPVTFR